MKNIVKNIVLLRRIKIIALFRNPYSIARLVSIWFQQPCGYVKAMLMQRCINAAQRCFDVASTLCHIVLAISGTDIVSTLWNVKNRRRFMFHFQRRINVISTLIHSIERTLIRRWNIGWECFQLECKYIFHFFITVFNKIIW